LLCSPTSAGEHAQTGAGGEGASEREPAPGGWVCRRGRDGGRECGGLAEAGDRFRQEGGQFGGEVEVVEAVPAPVFLPRVRAG